MTPAVESNSPPHAVTENEIPFPPDRAFVVQLRRRQAPDAEIFVGRVEHIASGEVTRFDSGAELMEFIARLGAINRASE
jgi:hypothetical protein